MSQPMLRIDLAELTIARVVCKKCGRGVIEVPIDRLDLALDHGQCRFCHHEFFASTGPEPLNSLRIAMKDLSRIKDDMGIEFEVPMPGVGHA